MATAEWCRAAGFHRLTRVRKTRKRHQNAPIGRPFSGNRFCADFCGMLFTLTDCLFAVQVVQGEARVRRTEGRSVHQHARRAHDPLP